MKIGKYKVEMNKVSALILFYLTMNTQLIGVEGYNVSYLKVVFMAIFSLVAISKLGSWTKTEWLGALYMCVVYLCVSIASRHLRISTIFYMALFVFSFCGFTSSLRNRDIPILQMIDILKYFIYAYFIVLVIQQIAVTVGFRSDILNIGALFENKYKLNMLAIEPSHAARIFMCLSLAYVKLVSLVNQYDGFKAFWHENKRICEIIIYVLLTMGSSTALLSLAILMCFFIQRKYITVIIPLLLVAYLIIPSINWDPLNRLKDTVDAVMTGDQSNIVEADGSAAARTGFYFSVLEYFDPSNTSYWVGHGVEEGTVYEIHSEMSEQQQIGNIYQYGMLSFIVCLLFVYVGIFDFLSIENLIFFLMLGFGLTNVYYIWGCMMTFYIIKYYSDRYKYLKDDKQKE